MAQTNRHKGPPQSTALRTLVALLGGGTLSYLAGGLVLLLGAFLLWSGRAPESAASHLCLAASALGGVLGGVWSARTLREKVLPAALVSAALGATLWLLTGALTLEGVTAGGAGTLLLSALAGGLVSALLCAR